MELKPGYKQTEVGVIPEDWEAVSIGTIASFTSGSGISVASLRGESSDTPVPVFGGNGVAGFTDRALVQVPTVVVGRVGQKCGEVYLTPGPAWITDNALYPRSRHREFDVRFLALALNGAGLNDVKNRNDLPLVTQTILHSVLIAWPLDVEEQRAIAEALSDVDALLAALDQLIAKQRNLKQATMQQLLTGQTRLPGFAGEWEVKPLGELASVTAGGTPSRTISKYWNGDIPWVTTSEIDFYTISHVEQFITKEGLNNSAAKLLPSGTLLMALYGQGKTRGKIGILGIEAATNQACAAIMLKPGVSRDFIFYFLASQYDAIRNLSNTGNQENLNGSLVRSISISLPPTLAEQIAIAAVLTDMDAELTALEQRRDKTRLLKQAMMQELLTGRTRLVG